jgi:hypothetical protein
VGALDRFRLDDRVAVVAVVTGAGRGIGAATAVALAESPGPRRSGPVWVPCVAAWPQRVAFSNPGGVTCADGSIQGYMSWFAG